MRLSLRLPDLTVDGPMNVITHLADELARRRERNRRYSIRGYARSLGVSHSTVSRLLRGGQRISAGTAHRLLTRLQLPGSVHEALLAQGEDLVASLANHPGFRPDSRWMAIMTGLDVDDVNVILYRLLSTRRLTMSGAEWHPEVPR